MNEAIEGQVYENKTKYEYDAKNNFVMESELVVTITLSEYRELIKKSVNLDSKNYELYELKTKYEKLETEFENQKNAYKELSMKHAELFKLYSEEHKD